MSLKLMQIAAQEVWNLPYAVLDLASDDWGLCLLAFGITAFLILLAKLLSNTVFRMGDMSEQVWDKIKKMMFDFIFFRFVYIGAVGEFCFTEVSIWQMWVAYIAFLRFVLLAADEYFTVLGTMYFDASRIREQKLLVRQAIILVSAVFVADFLLVYFVYFIFQELGYSVLAILLYENAVLFLSFCKVFHKYMIALQKQNRFSIAPDDDELNDALTPDATEIYIVDFIVETLIHALTLVHSMHVWGYYGISFTLIDFPLFLNVRRILVDLSKRLTAFLSTLRVFQAVNNQFPDASQEELFEDANDVKGNRVRKECSICLEELQQGKRLPCEHIFHTDCLRSWLQVKATCPVCRSSMSSGHVAADDVGVPDAAAIDAAHQAADLAAADDNQNDLDNGAEADGDAEIDDDPQSVLASRDALLRATRLIDRVSESLADPHSSSDRKRSRVQSAPAGASMNESKARGIDAAHEGKVESLFHFSTNRSSWLPQFRFDVVRGDVLSSSMVRSAENLTPHHEDVDLADVEAEEEAKSSDIETMNGHLNDEEESIEHIVRRGNIDIGHREFWSPPEAEETPEVKAKSRREKILEATTRRLAHDKREQNEEAQENGGHDDEEGGDAQ